MQTLLSKTLFCAALLALSAGAQAQAPHSKAQLTLAADAACKLQVNGKAAGALNLGVPRTLALPAGKVDIVCTGTDKALAPAREQLDLQAGETRSLRLRLRWVAVADGVMDRVGHLLWTRQDNGSDVDWAGAQAWCESLGQGWRLPSRAELEALTTGSAGETTPCRGARCKAPALFALSSYWMWSGDRNADGRATYHYLNTGHTQKSAVDYKLNARALCVKPE
jgi:hypothetical protein